MNEDKPNILLITLDEINRKALSCYGGPFDTPNIDRLASQGVLCENAYTPSPLCLPARCSIATGLEPHNSKSFCNHIGAPLDRDLPNIFTCLKKSGYKTGKVGKCHFIPVTYRQNVPDMTLPYDHFKLYYQSLGIDRLELQDDKQVSVWYYDDYAKELDKAGFLDAYRRNVWDKENRKKFKFPGPSEWHPDSWVGRKSVEYIDQSLPDANHFLWVSFSGPHYPEDPPEEFLGRVDISKDLPRKQNPAEFQDESKIHCPSFNGGGVIDGCQAADDRACGNYTEEYWREWRRHYYANVIQIDEWIGKILNAVEKCWGENVLVILTADHGDMMGEHGLWGKRNCAYDEVWKVPFIIKHPSIFQNRIASETVSTLDILPTCLSVAGEAPLECDGFSLVDLEKSGGREFAMAESDNFMAVTDGRYKYIECFQREKTYFEFYDMSQDPDEFFNQYRNPVYKIELERLKGVLGEKQRKEKMRDVLFYDHKGTPPWLWQ